MRHVLTMLIPKRSSIEKSDSIKQRIRIAAVSKLSAEILGAGKVAVRIEEKITPGPIGDTFQIFTFIDPIQNTPYLAKINANHLGRGFMSRIWHAIRND